MLSGSTYLLYILLGPYWPYLLGIVTWGAVFTRKKKVYLGTLIIYSVPFLFGLLKPFPLFVVQVFLIIGLTPIAWYLLNLLLESIELRFFIVMAVFITIIFLEITSILLLFTDGQDFPPSVCAHSLYSGNPLERIAAKNCINLFFLKTLFIGGIPGGLFAWIFFNKLDQEKNKQTLIKIVSGGMAGITLYFLFLMILLIGTTKGSPEIRNFILSTFANFISIYSN